MKYFLLPDKDKEQGNDYKIVKVHDQDVQSFLIRHQQDVMHEGNSITEILMKVAPDIDIQ